MIDRNVPMIAGLASSWCGSTWERRGGELHGHPQGERGVKVFPRIHHEPLVSAPAFMRDVDRVGTTRSGCGLHRCVLGYKEPPTANS